MAWTKYSNVARDRRGSVIANIKIIVDYNDPAADRSALLLEIKDWSVGTGDGFTINVSTDADDFTLTEGSDFTAETSNAVTAENIASVINSKSNYEAKARTDYEGNPYVSIVYTNGHVDGTSNDDPNAWAFYTINGSNNGITKLAKDDSGTIKHQPIWTNPDGLFQFYVDAPVDIDIEASKSGQTFDNSYTDDITVAT